MSTGGILIVAKKNHGPSRKIANEIDKWLEARDICSWHAQGDSGKLDLSMSPDLAVVLGGDGTILGVARCLAGKNIPIFGINFGKVGFLTTADPHNWEERLSRAIAGQEQVRQCAALNWSISRGDEAMRSGIAINDVVLGHGALARLIGIDVSINGMNMGRLRCDGLIVCTPLGSSGYSASAGGPVVYAGMNAICLTPICPFQAEVSPLVFAEKVSFELKITPPTPDCHVTLDGQICLPIAEDECLKVNLQPGALRFFGGQALFLERLRARGFCVF